MTSAGRRESTQDFAFLGEEFLTWLWFRTETEGGEFALEGDRIVGVVFDDYLAFVPNDDDTEQILRRGAPTRCPEARAALRSGRRLRRARLAVALGELTWTVTVDGPTLALISIKLPEDSDAQSSEERERERAANFQLIAQIVRELYRTFLRLRLSRDYLSRDGERQARWMQAT